jgi:hypothetical protein
LIAIKPPVVPKEPPVDVQKLYQPTMPVYTQPTYAQNNQINQQQQYNAVTQRIPTPSNMYDPPVSHQQTTNGFHSVNNNVSNPIGIAQQQSMNQQRIATPVQDKLPKSPVPSEHAIIPAVFDELLKKCIDVSNTPVVKRKLEDVSKKLEILYDRLRDKTVSTVAYQCN